MTRPDDVLLGRAEIERAFTALGERLARRGVVADVFVVGGAAMALAYDAARVTRAAAEKTPPSAEPPTSGTAGAQDSPRLRHPGQQRSHFRVGQ